MSVYFETKYKLCVTCNIEARPLVKLEKRLPLVRAWSIQVRKKTFKKSVHFEKDFQSSEKSAFEEFH